MKRWIYIFALGLWLASFQTSPGTGAEVVVVYNSRLPESRTLAYYYARKRDVPPEQVLGLPMATGEVISRQEYQNELQRPIAKKLEELKLWRIGRGVLPDTNNTTRAVSRKVVESKIRYAVLCYGVPLKIRLDSDLREPGDETLRPEVRRNGAAVDSELAGLPQTYSGYLLAGPLLNPLYTTTNAAQLHPTNGILLVARLDGPTPEIARGLVDKALQAEKEGLWGRMYFDARNISDPGYKIGDDWIRAAAQMAKHQGFDTVLDEKGDTFPASFPLSQIALYMGWYREHVSGPFTLPQVEFRPGAFAYHLHSFSAPSIRTATAHWVGPLLAKGVTCTMGTVDEPFLTGTPDLSAFFGRWSFYGFTFGEAAYAAQGILSWQTTVVGDPLYRPFGKNLQEQHNHLVTQTNDLVEWSTTRLVNISRNQGGSVAELAAALEQMPQTKSSAVLTEKLAELYDAQGKPASTLLMYERALTLKSTPQQRLRLRLEFGDKLIAADRKDDARQNFEKLLEENPSHANEVIIQQKISALRPKPE